MAASRAQEQAHRQLLGEGSSSARPMLARPGASAAPTSYRATAQSNASGKKRKIEESGTQDDKKQYSSSVQKALSGSSRRQPRENDATRSSSPPPSSSPEEKVFLSSSEEQKKTIPTSRAPSLRALALAAQQRRMLQDEPNEMKLFLRSGHQIKSDQLTIGASMAHSGSRRFEEDISHFIRHPRTLQEHTIPTGVDLVKPGTRIFREAAWGSVNHLTHEADLHPELYNTQFLRQVSNVAVSTTGPFVHAYVYRNNHAAVDPRQRRSAGDVMIIDERQGIFVALTKKGSIKSARFESPEALRNYLLDERMKDLARNLTKNRS
jgi:hypothetical protein